MAVGYVYILFNPSFRSHRYKIGMTTRTPKERATEISHGTGIPEPFEVVYSKKVVDCQMAEQLIKGYLKELKISANREFYDVKLQDAVKLLNSVANEVGTIPDDKKYIRKPHIDITVNTNEFEADIHVPPKKRTNSSINSKPGKKTIEMHLSVCDSSIKILFEKFRTKVKNINSDIQENSWSYGVAYKVKKNFVELYFRSNRLDVCLRPIKYKDPRGLLGSVPSSYNWTLNRRFLLEEDSQIDYIISLVKQSYEDVL